MLIFLLLDGVLPVLCLVKPDWPDTCPREALEEFYAYPYSLFYEGVPWILGSMPLAGGGLRVPRAPALAVSSS